MDIDKITLISKEIDGAELHNLQARDSQHVRCTGGANDNERIREAIDRIENHDGKIISIPAHIWERIFGRHNG